MASLSLTLLLHIRTRVQQKDRGLRCEELSHAVRNVRKDMQTRSIPACLRHA
uniref:Uncharacterized protein n=1 Tax=Anguilla anguilla TaxID=7936 RepID=A0A0E9PD12_ANGAN